MNRVVRTALLIVAAFLFIVCGNLMAQPEIKLVSPDHAIQIEFSSAQAGVSYKILFHGRAVLQPAPMRIAAQNDPSIDAVSFGKPDHYAVNESYLWYGAHPHVDIHGKGMRVPVVRKDGATAYIIDARIFDSGFAFRLILPGETTRVPEETVGFYPVTDSVIWSFDPSKDFYEGIYEATSAAGLPKGRLAAPPVTIELPNSAGYLAITESNLKNFYGMALQSDGNGRLFVTPGSDIPPDKPFLNYHGAAEAKRLSVRVPMRGTITTPWRVVMVASTLNDLVNSDLVGSLADPPDSQLFPQGISTPWIKPGRAVWLYLDGGAWTFEGAKKFSRLAGELGFEYQVIEDQWEEWSDEQLKELVNYSKDRGVGIWVWKNRKDLNTPESRRSFFEHCNRVGIVGAKIDYFDSEAPEVVDFSLAILREAAEHHILVDLHGASKPTGEQRTWPNELTREGIEGLEHADAPRVTHEVTLPFTRLLAGPADYTPVIFDKGLNGTTWANQIASAVILTSPLLNFAANPTTMVNNPAVSVLRAIPSTWDETIVLPPSKIGELAVFARRKGNVWFLAILNGGASKTLDIPLDFLETNTYQTELVGDVADKPASVTFQRRVYGKGDRVHLSLVPGGGFVARFVQP